METPYKLNYDVLCKLEIDKADKNIIEDIHNHNNKHVVLVSLMHKDGVKTNFWVPYDVAIYNKFWNVYNNVEDDLLTIWTADAPLTMPDGPDIEQSKFHNHAAFCGYFF